MSMRKAVIFSILSIAGATVGASGAGVPMRSDAVGALAAYTAPANAAPKYDAVYTPDGKLVERSEDGKFLFAVDVRDAGRRDTLINLNHTRETTLPDFEDFRLSPDGSKILLWRESQPVYRRSFEAKYYVYERRTRLLKPLSTVHERQRDPLFSPDSRMVAFVAGGNIICAKLDYGTEVPVTDDGAPNSIINGATDWTYEEEFTVTSLMSWAPDNLNLCYVRFDESAVSLYSLPLYRGTCDPMEQYALYPGELSYKYPVAGQPNSTVTLHSYDVETRKTKTIALPGNPCYIPRIEYADTPERLVVATLNREQNHYEIFAVNPKSTVARSIYTDDSRGWIIPEAYENLALEGNSLVVASDRDGWTRYYRVSYSGADMGAITDEGVDATAYYGTDAAGNSYWQSAAPTPADRTLRRRDLRGVTATLGATDGTSAATFSPDFSSYVLTYSDINTPTATTLHRADGRELRTLTDVAAYSLRALPLKGRKEFFSFEAGGVALNGYMVKPRDFDPGRRYPVIMSQYSGPGSQSVLNRWTLDWEDYYASQGYIIVCVDGRGTGGRGAAFRTIVYKNLGHYETIDQVSAARHVASLPFVDAAKIGIYGWSYGGYEALMAASADDCPYAAAVAVAPVTDWRFYDTVYTERYMLTPAQNESGYNSSSALRRALHLGCPLLMMYGTADDNVHPANTLQYVSTLQSAGILADMFVFPNMNHSINGCNARAVVYARMLSFFNKNM